MTIICMKCGTANPDDAATSCPHCGVVYEKLTDAYESKRYKPKKQFRLIPWKLSADQISTIAVGVVLALIVAGVFAWELMPHTPSNPDPARVAATGFYDCKQQVLSRLKAPSSAEFGDFDFASHQGNSYVLKSYVDAQNSFGAKLRNTFLCTVMVSGETARVTELQLLQAR